ncbi:MULTISPECIES: hypothetical protein [unclassified Nocardiopsis]|uniref:hypothetical protein n=1 Tax=Nocardiopsis TaxID=2013 RepID=UPI00387B7100
MAKKEDHGSDQLKRGAQDGEDAYSESPANAPKSVHSRGKGARTDGFEVDPALFVALTPQQRAAAVQALTELLTHQLSHTSEQ